MSPGTVLHNISVLSKSYTKGILLPGQCADVGIAPGAGARPLSTLSPPGSALGFAGAALRAAGRTVVVIVVAIGYQFVAVRVVATWYQAVFVIVVGTVTSRVTGSSSIMGVTMVVVRVTVTVAVLRDTSVRVRSRTEITVCSETTVVVDVSASVRVAVTVVVVI